MCWDDQGYGRSAFYGLLRQVSELGRPASPFTTWFQPIRWVSANAETNYFSENSLNISTNMVFSANAENTIPGERA